MREFSVPRTFSVGEHDSVVASVFSHEADDPDYAIMQRLIGGTWTDVTCAQVAAYVRATALGLIAEGVQPGDRVAILSATRFEWAIIDFAILSIGAVTVPIYETSSAEQIQFVLSDSGAVAAFAETDSHFETVDQLKPELPDLRHVYRIAGSGPAALDELARIGQDTEPGAVRERLDAIRSADVATLVYTSGTTGRPKGCQLTHSNLLHEMRGAKASFPQLLDEGGKLLVFLPLAHVLARSITISALSNKVTCGFTSDVKNLVPTLGVFKPTLVVSVPRVFEKVYNTAEQNARDGGREKIFAAAVDTAIAWSQAQDAGGQERSDTGKTSGGQERSDTGKTSGGQERSDTGKTSRGASLVLKAKHAVFDRLVYGKLRAALGGNCRAAISGGAPLGARLGHFYRGVGLTIYEGYGLTETSSAITVNQVDHVKVGSVGKLLPGNAMRLGDDGELLVSGGVVFGGYWHNQSETEAVFSDGWFHTGDLGAIDDQGFLTIVGRKKEIIVTAGGKNVAPALLEDRLRAHPLISQALVVGDAQPFIAALITIDPEAFVGWKQRSGKEASASVGDLVDDPALLAEIDGAVTDANRAVSHAESIRKFRILPVDFTEDTGELTPTLKVKRKVVAEKFAEDIDALYAKSGD